MRLTNTLRQLSFLLLLSCSFASWADTGFTAQYSATYKDIDVGTVNSQLATDGQQYTMVSSTVAEGIAALYKSGKQIETSHLSVKNGKLSGDKYSSVNETTRRKFRGGTETKTTTELEIDFDWNKGVARWKDEEQTRDIPLTAPTSDRHSLSLLVRHQLKTALSSSNQAPQEISVPFLNKATLRQYDFKLLGEEIVATKVGAMNCYKYQRISGSGRSTTLWLAKELDWHLAKFEKAKKGSVGAALLLESFLAK